MRPLDDLAAEMYEYYQEGHSLKQTGEKFGNRSAQTVWWMFNNRGWEMRGTGQVKTSANDSQIGLDTE